MKIRLSNHGFLLSLLLLRPLVASYQAMIITPVCDFTGAPQSHLRPLPLCPVQISEAAQACPRVHQGLFNEVVTILETRGQQVQVQISNCFYQTVDRPIPHTQYWTDRRHLLPLSKLTPQLPLIPAPINYQLPASLHNPQVVTLKIPYYLAETKQTYSAGTRFVLAASPTNRDAFAADFTNYHPTSSALNYHHLNRSVPLSQFKAPFTASQQLPKSAKQLSLTPPLDPVAGPSSYTVYLYDPRSQQFIQANLPLHVCALAANDRRLTAAAQRQCFIAILKHWTQPPANAEQANATKIKPTTSTSSRSSRAERSPATALRINSVAGCCERRTQDQHFTAPFIPYAWGGCSYTATCTDPHFQLKTTSVTKHLPQPQRRWFSYPTYNLKPATGFDCSGVILRAAQIAGLPYFYKNTVTILNNLKPLTATDELADG